MHNTACGNIICDVYVDDILVTRSVEACIQAIKDELHLHHPICDLGIPHYFLGVEFVY